MPRPKLAAARVVMEAYVEPAMAYYEEVLGRIAPYFFAPNLARLVGFQQLIVSRSYQIKREDARTTKGVDYVRECVSRIARPHDLIDVMRAWLAFDLNLTCPAFHDPLVATYIRKSYCLIGTKHWDCHRCPRTPCRENLRWDLSLVGLDVDAEGRLAETYRKYLEFFEDRGWSAAFKLSSLKGLHVNVGLPRGLGSTPFDRNVFQWIVVRALKDANLPVDDNSLDPVPILRAPFALHYRRLTPSLPFTEDTFNEAVETLRRIEKIPERERLEEATRLVKSWTGEWTASQVAPSAFEDDLNRWKEDAEAAIFREIRPTGQRATEASSILRKGREMSEGEARQAFAILRGEGKPELLARHIVENARKHEPKTEKPKAEDEVKLRDQTDVPEVVLNIPPPLLFLLVDNATIREMRELVGGDPVPVGAVCKTTNEGMETLFRVPRFFRRYGRKWNTKTAYIGGLHSAYQYCAAADYVLSVKETSPWERDAKVVDELERTLGREEFGGIVAHLLGLDYCKDQGLPTDGAMLVLRRLIRAALETDRNIVVTTDHSGEEAVPFFALLTTKADTQGVHG